MIIVPLEEVISLSIVGLYLSIGNALNPLNPATDYKQQHHKGGEELNKTSFGITRTSHTSYDVARSSLMDSIVSPKVKTAE
jgi:hypothetical protein